MRRLFPPNRSLIRPLILTAVLSIALVIVTVITGSEKKTVFYEDQVEAAGSYTAAAEALKHFRLDLGIPLSSEDYHESGLIGEMYTPLTTTVGDAGAKRTAAMPDMAALVVRLLSEAGAQQGDVVGVNMSGSFPGLNLAFLIACQTMDIQPVYTISASASMYGANIPGFAFPDMVLNLYEEGYLKWLPQAVSIGGDLDIGLELERPFVETLKAKLENASLPFLYEPDFEQNVLDRMSFYEAYGPVKVFVSIGGHTASLGLDDSAVIQTQGIIRPQYKVIDDKSGLIARYLSRGVPVIQLINLKRLAADYGLAFDPPSIPPIGQSAVYWESAYSVWISLISLILLVSMLVCFRLKRSKKDEKHREPSREK